MGSHKRCYHFATPVDVSACVRLAYPGGDDAVELKFTRYIFSLLVLHEDLGTASRSLDDIIKADSFGSKAKDLIDVLSATFTFCGRPASKCHYATLSLDNINTRCDAYKEEEEQMQVDV